MRYIREYYRVPAKRGAPVLFCGDYYNILSAKGAYLVIRSISGKRLIVHPTWNMEYINIKY